MYISFLVVLEFKNYAIIFQIKKKIGSRLMRQFISEIKA